MSERIHAPFTKEQVNKLNDYQTKSGWHPFTCGTVGCHQVIVDNKLKDGRIEVSTTLVATEDGWTCPKCDYTQDWAYDWMLLVKPLRL